MSTTKNQPVLTAADIERLQQLLLLLDPQAQAKVAPSVEVTECTATRKDGQPCQGKALKGRDVCVAHARGTQVKKAQQAPKAQKVQAEPSARALSKKSRADFAKAFVAQFGDVVNDLGVSILHWSTKAIAEYVVTTEGVAAPKGFRIGEGYQGLFS